MLTKENISDVPSASRELVDDGDVIKAINSDEVQTVLMVDEDVDDINENDTERDGTGASRKEAKKERKQRRG